MNANNKQLVKDIYRIGMLNSENFIRRVFVGLDHKDFINIENLEEIYEKKKKVKLRRCEIVYALNILENARACSIKNENNTIITRMRSEDVTKKLKELSDIDFLIFTKIENSQNNGIWTADLRKQTKLLVIGGSFYTDGEFNKKVVDYIRENICFYLYNNNNSNVMSVINYVKKLNNSVCYFSDNDIYRVIKTLLYEERIKIYKNNNDEEYIYYYNNEKKIFFHNFPCFSCDIFNKCNSDTKTAINPKNCLYLNFYLNLESD
ncbi:DNA-directed RNA polymerase III subunit RPC6, putative [Plasmodium malariae]|uniref:DNA-directed RNA polymerase III subunit RPC6 n=1 Tax=Plasmodium malariae TaxID=5858 RepID=A0A1C3KF87_PLAMA|nr:DNA-directed RNA polymerase III subunit RPC6, putative [Plasmodium malariae]